MAACAWRLVGAGSFRSSGREESEERLADQTKRDEPQLFSLCEIRLKRAKSDNGENRERASFFFFRTLFLSLVIDVSTAASHRPLILFFVLRACSVRFVWTGVKSACPTRIFIAAHCLLGLWSSVIHCRGVVEALVAFLAFLPSLLGYSALCPPELGNHRVRNQPGATAHTSPLTLHSPASRLLSPFSSLNPLPSPS